MRLIYNDFGLTQVIFDEIYELFYQLNQKIAICVHILQVKTVFFYNLTYRTCKSNNNIVSHFGLIEVIMRRSY